MNIIKHRCIGYSNEFQRTIIENMMEDGSIKYYEVRNWPNGLKSSGPLVDKRPFVDTTLINEWAYTTGG